MWKRKTNKRASATDRQLNEAEVSSPPAQEFMVINYLEHLTPGHKLKRILINL
jgi:hypothetical protein